LVAEIIRQPPASFISPPEAETGEIEFPAKHTVAPDKVLPGECAPAAAPVKHAMARVTSAGGVMTLMFLILECNYLNIIDPLHNVSIRPAPRRKTRKTSD
jgi:hypothetical protein